MAHLLLVTKYYPPEVGPDQTHLGETAARLVQMGHQVTVLTTLPSYPSGIVPRAYRHHRRRREVIDGVHIVRVWSYATPKRDFTHRILSQLSFGVLAGILGERAVKQPDVIIVLSPPLFTAFSARYLSWRKHRPLIFHVADVWPDAAVAMGLLHNRLIIRCSEWLERWAYRHSTAIWTVSEGFRRTIIEHGVPEERVFVVRIGADTTVLRPKDRAEARAELGWDRNTFVLLHMGTIALAHGLATVLDAAEEVREHTDISIMLAGDGVERASLTAEARRRGLTNLIFLGLQPHERVPTLLAAADACLVSVRNLPLFQGTLAVKMFEAMAAARPIVLAANGESRQIAEQQAGAAIAVEPGDAHALAQAILQLRDHPDLARELGQRGRAFMEAHLDRAKLVADLESHISAVREQAV